MFGAKPNINSAFHRYYRNVDFHNFTKLCSHFTSKSETMTNLKDK